MPDQLTKYRRYYNKLKAGIDEHSEYFENRADRVRESLMSAIRIGAWDPQEPITVYVNCVAGVSRHSVRSGLYRGADPTRNDLRDVREKIYGRLEEFESADILTWQEDDRFACSRFYPSLMMLAFVLEGRIDLTHFPKHRAVMETLYASEGVPITCSGTLGAGMPTEVTAILLFGDLVAGHNETTLKYMEDCPPKELERFPTSEPGYQLLKIAYYAALIQEGSASEDDVLALQVLDAGLVTYWLQEKTAHSGGYCLLPDEDVVFYRAVLAHLAGRPSDMDSIAAALRPRAILAQFEEVERLLRR